MVDAPALAPQQRVDAPEAVAHAAQGDLADARRQRRVVARARPALQGRPCQEQQRRGAPSRDTVLVNQPLGQRTFLRRPQSFFLRTSWSMWRSSDRWIFRNMLTPRSGVLNRI